MELTFIRCSHAIIVLLIFENMFYFKKNVLLCYFPFEISVLKYCSLFQSVRVIWFVWFVWFDLDAGHVGCWGCGMFKMWDVYRDVGCWFSKSRKLGMCDVGMWDVGDVGCWGCGMFAAMWDVDLQNAVSWGCGMLGMWDVGDVGCSGCGTFGMWDIRCGMLIYKMPFLATLTRSLAHTFRNVWSTSTLKNFCHSFYIFRIITHPLMDKRFP